MRDIEPNYPELNKHYPIAAMRRDQAAALAALPDASSLPDVETTPRLGPQINLHAVGDIQMGRGWPKERARLPPNNAMELLQHVKEHLQAADITFGNLENTLADSGIQVNAAPILRNASPFRVPAVYAEALKDAGFDTLSIANNHAGDFGEEDGAPPSMP
ncbi:MAG: CapA family protein [Myxococcota bacterium]